MECIDNNQVKKKENFVNTSDMQMSWNTQKSSKFYWKMNDTWTL